MRVSENTIINVASNLITEVVSDPYPLEHLIGFSVQTNFTGDSIFSGRIKIQCSDDEEVWSDYVSANIAYQGCPLTINVKEVFFKFMRIKIIVDAGKITALTCKVYAKGW